MAEKSCFLARMRAAARRRTDARSRGGRSAHALLRLDGRFDRLEGDLAVREMVAGEDLRAVGGVRVLEETAGLEPPSAHDDGDLGALLAVHSGEGRLERGALLGAAEIGEGFVAKVFEHGRAILSLHSAPREADMTVEELKANWTRGRRPASSTCARRASSRSRRYPFPGAAHPDGADARAAGRDPRRTGRSCAPAAAAAGARTVAAFLRAHGRDAVNLDGGILAWSARLDPSIPRY